MALRNIREIGDDILYKKAKEVKEITEKTRELIDDMLETMYEADGVGLAAPQVGVLKRIAVIDVTAEQDSLLLDNGGRVPLTPGMSGEAKRRWASYWRGDPMADPSAG